jgi:DNA-binding winged helix-turn-helix (wHTH) protein
MPSTDSVMAFGPYLLDPVSGRLLRGTTNVALRPKTFAVLEYLAARPGRLVATRELLDAVWPDTHVTPSVLTGCIREVRRALGDDAKGARFVETVHRRGYRFVAGADPDSTLADLVARILSLTRDGELAAPARRFADAVAAAIRRRERVNEPAATAAASQPRTARRQSARDTPSS